jgi:hypothetical protein
MESDLAQLYTFAVWMIGDREEGLRRATEVVRAAPTLGFVGWVRALLEPLVGRAGEPRHDRRNVLAALDDLLRTDQTVSPGDHPQIRRDPRRLRVLQWHLKRSCLLSVMRGVTVMPRAMFVLVAILGYSMAQVATMFGVTCNSVRINFGRAEKLLDNYLGARCQHIDPANSCRCETRLGVALDRGFVGWPERPGESPDRPVVSGAHSGVAAVYGSLPRFAMDASEKDVLLGLASP